MLTPEQLVLAAMLVCLGGAVTVLLVSGNKRVAGWFSFLVAAGSAALVLLAVARVLTSGPTPHPAPFWFMPKVGFALRIYVDGLSAMFLLLAAVIAVPAGFFSIRYMEHYRDYGVARYYPYFLAFLAAMYGLLTTTDMMWFFFIFWQMMTLPGYALIRYEHRKRENVRAANKYLIMMQIACAATMVGAEMLAVGGAVARGGTSLLYDFDTVSANLPVLLSAQPVATALAFLLFLVGFGIKMGMWPFGQVWLPDAHPAAPSPVSAMLSGVMIKTGVYGLMRYFLWLVPASALADYPLVQWGFVVAVLGTITLFTGTMQALRQEQSKRLLAFHSIGQVGYILFGTGVCMALLPFGAALSALATIGFMGALFHVLNHGLFKGLLFLNAGSMLHATGTQDLNRMGGLMKYMPLTAITALVASFSISGVPLFNGFVSKWSIYVAAIQGSHAAHYLVVCAIVAILTSALTLASFIKFFGVSFLSRTSVVVREEAARRGRLEVPWTMQAPQVFLGFCCVLLGVIPAIAFRLMERALGASQQGFGVVLGGSAAIAAAPFAGVSEAGAMSTFAPLALATVLGLAFLLAYSISRLGGASRRGTEPWLCGYVREAECHRYVAHNFYGEIKRYFWWLGGAAHPRAAKPALKELP
jgi:formate hydrogenlyase subunit 3/multisubunit Na+/H+ antiporter MnhD subunit